MVKFSSSVANSEENSVLHSNPIHIQFQNTAPESSSHLQLNPVWDFPVPATTPIAGVVIVVEFV